MNLQATTGRRADVNPNKAREQSLALMNEHPAYWRRHDFEEPRRMYEIAAIVRKTASFAKNVLAATPEALFDIASLQDVDSREEAVKIAAAARALLKRSADDPYQVDFDDMVWMPHHFQYGVAAETEMLRFDAVMVDEQQDLNAAQHWLVGKMRRGGRVVGFFDDRQTLYSFRGADRKAIEAILAASETRHVSLPISYRCPVSVIEKARVVVPDIEPAPDARDGSVTTHGYDEMCDTAEPGDFILSRTNAPLMVTCLRLLRRSVPATIAGRNIGQGLVKLIDKSKARSTSALTSWLHEWLGKEYERHLPEHPDRYENARDRAACLHAIMPGMTTAQELKTKIEAMFSDEDDASRVVCSTVHRAKGLERDRVWLLSDTFGYPNPKPWQDRWSEENIWYVAVTRAKDRLCFVDTPLKEMLPNRTTARPTKRKRQVTWRK